MTTTPTTTEPRSVAVSHDDGPARRPGRGSHRLLWYAGAIALAAVFVFPLYWAFVSSVKTEEQAAASPPTWFPEQFSTENYARMGEIGATGIYGALLNSAIATGLAIVFTVVLSTLAGYGFSRFRFPGRGIVFAFILLTFMIPFQSILIPLYQLLTELQLTNSMLGLALVYATWQLPFAVFVMRNSFDELPHTLDEAAMLDGCGTLRALVRVLLPSAVPGILTVVLFTFLFSWNELLAALVMVSDAERFTVPVQLSLVLSNQFGTVEWGALQAGVVLTVLPCMAIFFLLQRHYQAGATAGSVKE
ncbi:carbohydrate ABC transporter membrane protein 2 (CUT1 family) [Haloactinopolyspora alba]|uniref:Carbohydrate ABC transporter membrane protein 2 (CUT1 family) n=1 Tax=Haloactinopolyspora alba TaxID=648780 RepID=A0A2P8DY81_9ACTN|nr:carbohydrate ABC transporter permease [Haloactinopolyspora alba]PSL02174.1 carbohydrate ABC transporter membrane protein 2 (CUT1 family) [Haloactinopolyspora alba]